MESNSFLSLTKEERGSFYEEKFNYFQKMTYIIAIFVALGSMSYYMTDCQIFGYLQTETLLSRFSILVPLVIYIATYHRIKSYMIKTLFTLALCQMAHYCTIWSIVPLPAQTYVCAGVMVIQTSVFIAGFSAPFSWAVIAQLLVMVNLFVSNLFIHYTDFGLIITMNLPMVCGIIFSHYWLTKSVFERFMLQKRLREQTYTDQLTGLYNRHRLGQYVDSAGRFQQQYETPVSLLIMDVDFFKRVNDTYGHDKGDIVLQSVAALIKQHFDGENCLCLRWGGEEFVVVLFGYGEQRVCELADRFREKVKEQDNGVCTVTVSIGVAEFGSSADNYKEAIKRADLALYRAKANGRNQTVAYSALQDVTP